MTPVGVAPSAAAAVAPVSTRPTSPRRVPSRSVAYWVGQGILLLLVTLAIPLVIIAVGAPITLLVRLLITLLT